MKVKFKISEENAERLLAELNQAAQRAPALFYDPRSFLARLKAKLFRRVYSAQA